MDNKVINKIEDKEVLITCIFLTNYKAKHHVREIARLTNSNHRTILLALQRLEKKAVMKSEYVGKNKLYFLNLDNIATKTFIKMTEYGKTLVLLQENFLIKKFMNNIKLEKTSAILFGSYAKGKESRDSDIDVLLLGNKKDFPRVVAKINEFGKVYGKRIQIRKATEEQFYKGLQEKDNLIFEIINNHIILNNAEPFVNCLWRYYNERA
jgi:predicted nucleotidyltransferase